MSQSSLWDPAESYFSVIVGPPLRSARVPLSLSWCHRVNVVFQVFELLMFPFHPPPPTLQSSPVAPTPTCAVCTDPLL